MLRGIVGFVKRNEGERMKLNSKTLKILSREHENILKVIDALELEIEQLKNKKKFLLKKKKERKSVKIMKLGMDERAKNKLIEGARNYIQLIREHIYKEDNILYPMADEALSEDVQKTMLEKFNKINFAKKKQVEGFEKFANEMSEK